jgi:anti-anti-sigma factor
MDFFSALSLYAPKAHLALEGELDAFAAARLRVRLDEAVDRGCISFTIDASAVTFLDAGGLGLLVWLSNAVRPYGGTLTVLAASPRFRAVVTLVGLGEALGVDLLGDHEEFRPSVAWRCMRGPAAGYQPCHDVMQITYG